MRNSGQIVGVVYACSDQSDCSLPCVILNTHLSYRGRLVFLNDLQTDVSPSPLIDIIHVHVPELYIVCSCTGTVHCMSELYVSYWTFFCFYQETEFTLSEAKRNKIHTACRPYITRGVMIYIIIVLLFMATQHPG